MAFCQPQIRAGALSSRKQPSRSLATVSLRMTLGSSYHPLAVFLSFLAHLTFRYLTYETAPLGWEFLALPFSVTFASLICGPAPPDWAAQEFPKKKSCFPAEGGLLVPLLENYRHLDTWLWVFGIEINWIQFSCSHWVGKSPSIQLTAVPSHLPQYLFIDFMLKTSQLQKKFFLGKNGTLSGKIGVLLLWICAVEKKEVNISFVRMAIEPKEWKDVLLMLSLKGYF